MVSKDYYKILGIKKKASQDAIKRAYRKLARKYHPDVNKALSAVEKFNTITEAYEILKDVNKRKEYDTNRSFAQAGRDSQHTPNWDNQFGKDRPKAQQASSAPFSDFFNFQFKGGTHHFSSEDLYSFEHEYPEQGHDLHAKILIHPEESYHGGKRTITLNREVRAVNGRQSIQPQSLNVIIPKGVIEGQQIRLEGQGEVAPGQGKPGNLFLEIVFEPHPLFTVTKRDIFITLPITPWEAALGSTIAVPTLGGDVDLKVPPNSQTGKTLRLKGRGLSSKNKEGHQYVNLVIRTPAATTDEQRALYEKMAILMPYNPRLKLGD